MKVKGPRWKNIYAVQKRNPNKFVYDDIKEDSSSIEQEQIDERILIKHAKSSNL